MKKSDIFLEKLIKKLRQEFGKYCDKTVDGVMPLKKITLVGAETELKPENSKYGFLSENDYKYLELTLKNLHNAGIPVSPNFEVDVVNLKDGRDFLTESKLSDLIVICNLDPPNSKNLWSKRITQSKAKIVSIVGYMHDYSLLPKDIESEGLSTVFFDNKANIGSRIFFGKGTNSILMTPEYISSIAKHLKDGEIKNNVMSELNPANLVVSSYASLIREQARKSTAPPLGNR